MGLSQSANVIANRWDFVLRAGADYSIVRDKSGRQGEEYEIPIRSQTIPSQQFSIYSMRKVSPHQIVAVYGSEFKNQPSICSADASFRVITEHLCIRFCDPFLLNAQEVLYLLNQSMKGFSFLYSKVGCFQVTNKMMGLTSEGELRVWMHEKFGENSPQYPKKSIKTVGLAKNNGINQQQTHMIKQIFEIVQSHAEKVVIERYLKRYRLQYYNFATINAIFVQLAQKFNITCAQRIDIMKKSSNFII